MAVFEVEFCRAAEVTRDRFEGMLPVLAAYQDDEGDDAIAG